MLIPPAKPLTEISLRGAHRVVFWPVPMAGPPKLIWCVNEGDIISFYWDDACSKSMGFACGLDHIYPGDCFSELSAWYVEYGTAYDEQVQKEQHEAYVQAHPSWEFTVTYPEVITRVMLNSIFLLERNEVPWHEWPEDLGAAKRVIDYYKLRDLGVRLFDPDTRAPLISQAEIARTLNTTHGCVAMTAADWNQCHVLAKLSYPRASSWVFFSEADVADVVEPSGEAV